MAWSRKALMGLACAVSALAGPCLAAPDEARYGAAAGYTAGDRSNWSRLEHVVGAYTAMEQLFPVRAVAAGGTVRALPQGESPKWPFVQTYLDTHPATGLLVLKDGKLLVERYQYARGPEHRFTSFSMAKTVVAMAVGIAIDEGKIGGIDDAVDRYEPALAGTAWQGVSLRQVLNMASGVRFDETYDKAGTDIARLSLPWTRQQGGLLETVISFKARDTEPGARFHYVSAETVVLAQVLKRATGRQLADYVSEKIWSPMGAESDAFWVLDSRGSEAAHCCLSARLRDWARLGQLLLDGGQRDGRSVIPKAWVEAATSVRPADGHLRPRRATPYFGYGLQTWIFPDDLGFALLGVRGQSIFVHPRLRLVMVQTAVWPSSTDAALARQRDGLWRQLIQAAKGL